MCLMDKDFIFAFSSSFLFYKLAGVGLILRLFGYASCDSFEVIIIIAR